MNIHPTAIIEAGAFVDPSARIGPYTIIEAGAVIGPDCVIDSCVRIFGVTRMGRGNRVCHGATIGAEPHDLGFTPEKSKPLVIGDHNHFKESVNISRGVKTAEGTRVGSHNYLMAFAHIGHDCIVGDHNVFANAATLGGHVELAHHSFLSGHVAVHQFCRVGAYTMLGGVSGYVQDVPPYVMANGQRGEITGLNVVGLRRNGFDQARRSQIKAVYRLLMRSGLRQAEAIARAQAELPGAETDTIIDFIEGSRRGVIGFGRRAQAD